MQVKSDNETENSISTSPQQVVEVLKVKFIEHALLLSLCIINALSYMDRYLFGALLPLLEVDFEINDAAAGLIYGTFAIVYALFYPLVIYLAQYYRHRRFLRNAVLFWIAFSAMTGVCHNVYIFVYLRLLLACCQATFAAVAPQVVTKVAGKYHKQGAVWLQVYRIAGPLGVGAGFALTSQLLKMQVSWHFCFYIVPALLLLNLPILCLVRINEPSLPAVNSSISDHPTWNCKLMQEIYAIPTELLATIGCIFAAFYSNAVYLWLPLLLQRHYQTLHEVLLYAAAILTATTLSGMLLAISISSALYKYAQFIDALLSALSLLLSTLILAAMLFYSSTNMFLFAATHFLYSMHAPLANELLAYVVPPAQRIYAKSLCSVLVNVCGDAVSAMTVGVLATCFENSTTALQHAFSFIIVLQLFAALCFCWAAFFVQHDREQVRLAYPARERQMQPRHKRAFITVRSLSEMSTTINE